MLQQDSKTGPSVEKNDPDLTDSEEEVDDNIEPEMDDDTQVSSNCPGDKSSMGRVRTRGGSNVSGKNNQ